MHCWHFATLSSCNNVSKFSTSNIQCRDIILVERIIWQVFIRILRLFLATKEFLFSSFKILTNSKSSSCENDLIIWFSKMNAILVPITSETVNVIDFESNIWLWRIIRILFRRLFVNEFQESLIALFFLWYFFIHAVVFFNQQKYLLKINRRFI